MRMVTWVMTLLLLGVGLASSPAATAAGYNLPISVGPRDCKGEDAKGRPAFFYSVKWTSSASDPIDYIISSPVACRMEGAPANAKPCSGAGPECKKSCKGTCEVKLTNCSTSGNSWVQVSTPDQSLVSKRVLATGPADKCLNR